ncbi:CBN-RBG-1 protein [Caenorhabditis brenneri]|uniref:Rab3 GTPase-activating protein catalytic subunit n=1 Tax=Caenorhabditis brenneri TaxID=135651 RepID=G0MB26_CAEBE|nr:CBN-RBG-1 protein [Caenorhabditis brenneri]
MAEMEENTVFEINDFTIVTDMEHFGAAFEGILQKYEFSGRRPCLPDDVKYRMTVADTNLISIGNSKLRVELLQPIPISPENSGPATSETNTEEHDDAYVPPFAVAEEVANVKHGFECTDSFLLKFGVRECIVIVPNDSSATFTDENHVNAVMGNIRAILHASRCEVPVFCYIKDQSLDMIAGYASDGNSTYKFSTVALRNINDRHCTMSALLFLFKENLGASTSAFHDEVRMSCRFTHVVPLKQNEYFRNHTVDSFGVLATGPSSSLPFDTLEVAATWRFFRENSLTENYAHSDFDINYSTYWTVKMKSTKTSLLGVFDEILSVYKEETRKAIRTDLNCAAILQKYYTPKDLPNAFQKLTVNSASEVKIGKHGEQPDVEGTNGPMSPALMRAWVDFIFDPSSDTELLSHELNLLNASSLGHQFSEEDLVDNVKLDTLFNYKYPHRSNTFHAPYKCAKKTTVTWRLAIALANARVFMTDQPRAEPQLWIEFLLKLREKYEKMEFVENVNNGIDHMQCGFSQKMQMLQMCVDARLKRHRMFDPNTSNRSDEFFDASETFNAETVMEPNNEGRYKLAGGNLIGNPDMPMYVPVTQDACPLTDEMIDARNEHLFSLNEEERVNLQMELVISDMQSFKAANPGAVFADFLRWHSPKDYDEKTNTISERMLIPNNVWVRSWEAAEPVPVANQARIFNDTKIAEEIFELFNSATLDQVRDWMKPTTFAATLERLIEIESSYEISEEKKNQRVSNAKTLAAATLNNSTKEYNKIAEYCSQMEMIHNMKVHLIHLFQNAKQKMHPPHPSETEIQNAIKQLIDIAEHNVWGCSGETEPVFTVKPQDPIGRALAAMGKLDELTEKQLLNGHRKEYIFIWNFKRPSTTTLPMSHRMYADLRRDKHSLYFSAGNDCNFSNASYL